MEHKFKVGDILKRRDRAYKGYPSSILITQTYRMRGVDFYGFLNLDGGRIERLASHILEVDYKKAA